MASNPMQRQKKLSFWKGVLITLLLCAIVIGGLGYMLYQKIDAEKKLKASMVQVYTLTTDVSSGQAVTSDMLKMLTVSRTTVPSNAISDSSVFSSYSLQDENGNEIYTDSQGLYVKDGNKTVRITQDDNGNYIKNNETIKLTEVPLIAKVDMKANTVLTKELVAQSDEVNTDDVRTQEFNMVTLPTTLETGDFVDIRLRLPNGTDYIVVSKKEVNIPDIAGVPSTDTMEAKMSEDEILTMSNAIVEAYIVKGSELYATKYTDPGNQAKSTPTYPVSKETMDLINNDSNIVETAKNALWARYNTDQRNGNVNNNLNKNTEDSADNVEKGIEDQIQKQKELRQNYLEALSGGETSTTTTSSSSTTTSSSK